MGKNIITALITFILLLSIIPVIFKLSYGFMITELIIFVVLLIFGAMAIFNILSNGNSWSSLFVFYVLNAINVFVIYSRTHILTELIIPFIAIILGLYISALSIRNDEDDMDVEPYYEEKHEIVVDKPKKKSKKKKSK